MPVGDYYSSETNRIRKPDDTFLHREKICLNYLSSLPNESATLVDLGCGTGWFMARVKEKHPRIHVVGLEYSADQIAEKESDDLEILQADFGQVLPLPDSFADIVYSGEVIEHLVDPDFFLKEIRRILKPGGLIVITTPNLCSWHSRILMLIGIQPIFYEASSEDARIGFGPLKALKKDAMPVGHLRLFSKRSLIDILIRYTFVPDYVAGSRFDYFHGLFGFLDKIFSRSPGIASGLVITARKT
jgi:SAM-dependent methyltransferase